MADTHTVTPLEQHQHHVDVLIVGAGLSGIAAGYHLQAGCPGKSYAILESRDSIGGTWDLFRYPGIRSDSDMFTLGYGFRPWKAAKAIADGPAILEYVKDTAREYGIDRHIRFNHRVVRAEWSSDDQRWTVEVERTDTQETVQLTAGFLFTCTGYYRYDEGYTPELPGTERFKGQIVHPQHWSDDVDYAGKRVVVIGSGATAVTLVPAMAPDAEHVTMLQRSPSYVVSIPNEDPIAKLIRRVVPERWAHAAVRWKNVLLTMGVFQLSRRAPKFMRKLIRAGVKKALPEGYDVDTHFNPRYNPWDQRVCLVPDGDLFEALGSGRASIVTDRIASFTETGIELESGQTLEADLVVTATGLNLLALGGMQLSVDGREVDPSETLTYRGMMIGDVPNLALAVGYTNASWTLKADLICQYVTRLLNHMDAQGYTQATPRPERKDGPTQPFLNLTSGYVQRSVDQFPRQGMEAPWRIHQNYLRDIALIRRGDLAEGMEFATVAASRPSSERMAA
ncbi:MAG TPA: NAD(P)/FAD-dependent oxidoreductase [Solirubrobacteraceae bacterium]